jgi:Protein of unknown function with HXXEE motif
VRPEVCSHHPDHLIPFLSKLRDPLIQDGLYSLWRRSSDAHLALSVVADFTKLLGRPTPDTAPAYFDLMAHRLPISWPSAGAFQIAAAVLTMAGLGLTIIAVRWSRPGLITLLATIMLVNVVVPHVPLALFSGGYAPGLATALLLNLPIDLLWLLQRRRQER